jgi:hypothetical protein
MREAKELGDEKKRGETMGKGGRGGGEPAG